MQEWLTKIDNLEVLKSFLRANVILDKHNRDCMFYESESDGGCGWGLEGRCGANKNACFDIEEGEIGC